MIMESVVIYLIGIGLIWFILSELRILEAIIFKLKRNLTCEDCKIVLPKEEFHQVLHGMGMDSDSYVTYHCNNCIHHQGGILTKHYMGKVEK